ncbi:hypothetical protein [Bradyrhizobium genosp. P]|uniref:hypothetical protein n=1 Tax=Bradyrhizobium genosp. P TaxID=83641 RepID=UPI003CF1C65E
MAGKKNQGSRLLRRFEQLKARAASVQPDDRAQLYALLDDIGTVRDQLIRECARLDEQINRTTVQATAITAYGRSARLVRGPRRVH